MEPRAVVGDYHPVSGRYTLYTSCQGAHGTKATFAKHTLRVPEEAVHVIVGDVGGAFGSKAFHYAEETLCVVGAKQLGRPIKWTGDRGEAFTCDTHGRDQRNTWRRRSTPTGGFSRFASTPSPTWGPISIISGRPSRRR